MCLSDSLSILVREEKPSTAILTKPLLLSVELVVDGPLALRQFSLSWIRTSQDVMPR